MDSTSDCDSNRFCGTSFGSCDTSSQNRFCKLYTDSCSDIFDPVCGCNGGTYDNPCLATNARANIRSYGSCPTSCDTTSDCPSDSWCRDGSCQDYALNGESCGGTSLSSQERCIPSNYCVRYGSDDYGTCHRSCSNSADCTGSQFCATVGLDCSAYRYCASETESCPDFRPVCGCNSVSYENPCEAYRAGESVRSMGVC